MNMLDWLSSSPSDVDGPQLEALTVTFGASPRGPELWLRGKTAAAGNFISALEIGSSDDLEDAALCLKSGARIALGCLHAGFLRDVRRAGEATLVYLGPTGATVHRAVALFQG